MPLMLKIVTMMPAIIIPALIKIAERFLGIPNKKEAIDFYLSDYVKDKEGNIYIVGSEVFYPSGSPDEIPDGECGNVEQVLGALVAKLDGKGKTVWVKVIDRND